MIFQYGLDSVLIQRVIICLEDLNNYYYTFLYSFFFLHQFQKNVILYRHLYGPWDLQNSGIQKVYVYSELIAMALKLFSQFKKSFQSLDLLQCKIMLMFRMV